MQPAWQNVLRTHIIFSATAQTAFFGPIIILAASYAAMGAMQERLVVI